MRTTRTVPARPALIVTLTLATAGSLLLAPGTAGADPKPVTREGAALDGRAAQAPASAARRALAVLGTGVRVGQPDGGACVVAGL
ncbi:hypothetical protein ABZZ16_39680, partial [Streptomyces sp. NPDC006386]|uniref:hypothetical protein n=1 Tax=Streptomyces sp. NPDC006386 TaxID=3156762 RepID=UPI0033BE5822